MCEIIAAITMIESSVTTPSRIITRADTTMITIQNYAFMPPELVVKPGTTVTWVNKDDSPHTITSTDHVVASKAMDTDDQYSFTFEKEGDYKYFCTLHPYMVGLVKVRAQ